MSDIVDDIAVMLSQVRAWFAVNNLCYKLGMEHVDGCSGLEDVLAFIRGLHEAAQTHPPAHNKRKPKCRTAHSRMR